MSETTMADIQLGHIRQQAKAQNSPWVAGTIHNLCDEIERLRKENEGYKREYLEVKRLLKEAHDKPCGEYWRDYHVMPLTRRLKEAREDAEQAREEALKEAAQVVEDYYSGAVSRHDLETIQAKLSERIRALKDTTREGAD